MKRVACEKTVVGDLKKVKKKKFFQPLCIHLFQAKYILSERPCLGTISQDLCLLASKEFIDI